MVPRARGGEAQGAGVDRFAGQAGHLRHLFFGRGISRRPPIAHDEEAQGAVGDLGGYVDVPWLALEGVEVVGKAFPVPRQPFVEGCPRDVLDALHQLDEHVVVRGAHGREADAAVPHDNRGDAVPRRRCDAVVPRGLPVVVGVDVDEAGGDDGAVGVDAAAGLPDAGAVAVADRADSVAVDGHVGPPGRRPGPVDDGCAGDHQVMGHGSPLRWREGPLRRKSSGRGGPRPARRPWTGRRR